MPTDYECICPWSKTSKIILNVICICLISLFKKSAFQLCWVFFNKSFLLHLYFFVWLVFFNALNAIFSELLYKSKYLSLFLMGSCYNGTAIVANLTIKGRGRQFELNFYWVQVKWQLPWRLQSGEATTIWFIDSSQLTKKSYTFKHCCTARVFLLKYNN